MRVTSLVLAILGTLFWGLAAVVSLWPMMFSPMLFDAPGSDRNAALWTVVLSLGSFPFVVLAAIVATWTLFAFRRHALSIVVLALPVVPLAIMVVAFTQIPNFF